MNSPHSTLSPLGRTFAAATVALLAGSAAAFAQTSSSQSSPPPNSSTGTYNSDTSRSSDSSRSSGSGSTMMGDDDSTTAAGSRSTSVSHEKLSWGDRRFVTKAAEAGQDEVQLAQLATHKASSPDVKQFAQQLIDQHAEVNSQLMTLANSKNVKVEQDDATKDRAYRRLNKTSGAEFDREFVDHMVEQHEKDIKMYEKAANDAKDPEVRQFASTNLEHLRQHFSQVQQLQQSIVPTGRTGKDSWRSPPYGETPGASGPSDSTNAPTSGSSAGPGMSGSSGAKGSSSNTIR